MRFLSPMILLIAVSGCSQQTAEPSADAVRGTVTVEIALGDASQTFVVDEVVEGETVESVMRKIKGGDISISGSGTTAFVNQIGDQTTAQGKGWTYTINGQRAERGIGAMTLSPPATVTWKYGSFEP